MSETLGHRNSWSPWPEHRLSSRSRQLPPDAHLPKKSTPRGPIQDWPEGSRFPGGGDDGNPVGRPTEAPALDWLKSRRNQELPQTCAAENVQVNGRLDVGPRLWIELCPQRVGVAGLRK